VVSGRSILDELPEAIEMDRSPPTGSPSRRFVLGVQWHPEADVASSVIGALVEAATVEPAGHVQARRIAS